MADSETTIKKPLTNEQLWGVPPKLMPQEYTKAEKDEVNELMDLHDNIVEEQKSKGE